VIGAALNTKKYPLHKLEAFCLALDHPIVLLGGKQDQENGNRLASLDPYKIYNACGKFRINESADLVRRARLIVTNDTGLMHIAAALKKPVISLWGNTVPAFGMYPYYGENFLAAFANGNNRGSHTQPYEMVEVKNLGCRPCSKIGHKKCPLGHFKCMEMIETSIVLEKVKERINRDAAN
jgi:ADP-heptose:LPS heptosyltransferase